ncbi:MAG: acyl carrier protein [Candidatus Lindowbacteria bacterium RIFCSPLOWO2_12_FULL_62_27]|nr:MAG: acyl carrier protein [Candidatus Lindowbacteria bacterium RIFCSPLOWO2_12_FULL_62_27]OGH61881.1 MAG: acyl carrier protein [Candidatus Lindowbacteria bacterium RIFCSPLOWO2_02_FULL_62_12]
MLTREDIFERVRDIILERLSVKKEKVTLDANFLDDLGADSLELTELVLAVEEEFSLKIPDDQIENLTTVGKVVTFVETCLSSTA